MLISNRKSISIEIYGKVYCNVFSDLPEKYNHVPTSSEKNLLSDNFNFIFTRNEDLTRQNKCTIFQELSIQCRKFRETVFN